MLGVARIRRGFSVAELLVSIMLLVIVGGAVAEAMRRQQQLFRSIARMIGVRSDVRDAAAVLASDLAAASPLDTISLPADSAVEFFSTIAHSVSCDSAPGYTLRLPPETTRNPRVTSMLATPDTGDVVLLYNDDTATVGAPRWDRHAIAAVSSQQAGITCPASTGFTTAADAALPSRIVTLRSPASGAVRAGAAVRVIRRVRYSLYRSSDGRWYLGNRRCNALGAPACGTIQPLSGPYAPYAGSQSSGLSLSYFGADRAVLSSSHAPWATARVDIAVRGRPSMIAPPGRSRSLPYLDSAAVVVALRNRD